MLSLTATAIDANEVSLAVTGAAAGVSLYRSTTEVADMTDLDDATPLTSGVTAASWTDFTTSAATGYYYYATDGTEWAASGLVTTPSPGEFVPDFVPKNLVANTTTAIVDRQNSSGMFDFNLPVTTGNIAVLVLKTGTELTDAALATLFSGQDVKFQILAKDNITAVTGYSTALVGSMQLKYLEAE